MLLNEQHICQTAVTESQPFGLKEVMFIPIESKSTVKELLILLHDYTTIS